MERIQGCCPVLPFGLLHSTSIVSAVREINGEHGERFHKDITTMETRIRANRVHQYVG